MGTSEIVTLQIGHYSNFVGSHWWNCQESSFVYDPKIVAQYPKEVNHDVFYREGHTVRGEVTYTPRLILYDLNNSLGSMKREGFLYDITAEDDIQWQGDVTLHQAQAAEKNPFLQDLEREFEETEETSERNKTKLIEDSDGEFSPRQNDQCEEEASEKNDVPARQLFYQLDDGVDVWSDYLRTSLHSKTVNIIKEHQHNNPEQPFDVFGIGEKVLSTRESLDNMEDRVRFFTEECDHLQGFQILLDTHNAFGGFAVPILSYLADEYPSKSRFSFSLTPACPPDQSPRERSCRMINSALSLQACIGHNSLHVPLSLASTLWRSVGSPMSFTGLQYKSSLDYHTSAILSTALDTLTLPYRRQYNPFKICDITSTFSNYGRKVAALNASLPLPITQHSTFADHLMTSRDSDPWTSLTPHVRCVNTPSYHSCVVRGLPTNKVSSEPKSGGSYSASPLSSCSTVDEVFDLYLGERYTGAMNAGFVMRDGVKLDKSFPHIFKANIGTDGYIRDISRPPFTSVESIPLMTSLQSSPDIHSYIHSLTSSVSRLNINKHQHFLEAGLDLDDFKETIQDLEELGQCYSS